MDTIPHDHSGADAPQEVANLGIVRPPLVYGAAIVAGLLLEFGWPLPFLPRLLAALLGSFLVLVAVIVFAYAIRTFQTAGTPVPGNQPTTVMVRTGPYRFSPFLSSTATIAQRIVRGKAKIRDAKIPYDVPALAELGGKSSPCMTS